MKRINFLALCLYVLTMMVGIVLAVTEFDNPYLLVTGILLFVANAILFYSAIVEYEDIKQK